MEGAIRDVRTTNFYSTFARFEGFCSTTRSHPFRKCSVEKRLINFSYPVASRNSGPLNRKYAGYWPRYSHDTMSRSAPDAYLITALRVFVLYSTGKVSRSARPCVRATIQGWWRFGTSFAI